jgi:hypothetical protein
MLRDAGRPKGHLHSQSGGEVCDRQERRYCGGLCAMGLTPRWKCGTVEHLKPASSIVRKATSVSVAKELNRFFRCDLSGILRGSSLIAHTNTESCTIVIIVGLLQSQLIPGLEDATMSQFETHHSVTGSSTERLSSALWVTAQI